MDQTAQRARKQEMEEKIGGTGTASFEGGKMNERDKNSPQALFSTSVVHRES